MNDEQRDELLLRLDENMVRLDEKTTTILETQAHQSRHLAMINGNLDKHKDNITMLNTTVYGRNSDKGLCGDVLWLRKLIYCLFAIIITGGTISGLEIGNVIHLFGR